jgi:hypothetical protein
VEHKSINMTHFNLFGMPRHLLHFEHIRHQTSALLSLYTHSLVVDKNRAKASWLFYHPPLLPTRDSLTRPLRAMSVV